MSTDFIDANFTALGEVASKDALPDFVKQADQITAEDTAPLLAEAFADRRNRKLPIHTKAAAYLSALFYYGHRSPDLVVEDRLKKAADFHGISTEVAAIPQLLTYTEKRASAPSVKFALSIDRGEARGGVQNYYPMNDDYEVVKSAREADKAFYDGRLPAEYFREVSLKLCKSASEFGLKNYELPRSVRENGADRLPDWDRVKRAAVLSRKQAGVDPDGLAIYASIIDTAENEGVDEAESLWNRMDEVCGVKYANAPTLYELLYNGDTMETGEVEKLANENVVINGVTVPANVVTAIPQSKVQAYFEEKRASAIWEIIETAKKDCPKASVKSAALHKEDASTFLEMVLKWAS